MHIFQCVIVTADDFESAFDIIAALMAEIVC
jgi:hypothetical protein